MRITEIELKGKRHILCLNLWALKRIYAHWGDYGSAIRAITEGATLERTGEQLIFLHTLLVGGAIYASEMGMENPEPPTMTELISGDSSELLSNLLRYLTNAIDSSMFTQIEIQHEPGEKTKVPDSVELYVWYGLKIGLSYREAHAIPLGELLDLIGVEQLKREGAKLQRSEEDEFFELLKRR